MQQSNAIEHFVVLRRKMGVSAIEKRRAANISGQQLSGRSLPPRLFLDYRRRKPGALARVDVRPHQTAIPGSPNFAAPERKQLADAWIDALIESALLSATRRRFCSDKK
ncbi:hypothetical protein MRX96_057129 [Rhipicephalus microplus]